MPHKILKIMTQFKQDVVKLNQSWGVGLKLGLGVEGGKGEYSARLGGVELSL